MFEIVMGIDDFLIQLVKYCDKVNENFMIDLDLPGFRQVNVKIHFIFLLISVFCISILVS